MYVCVKARNAHCNVHSKQKETKIRDEKKKENKSKMRKYIAKEENANELNKSVQK